MGTLQSMDAPRTARARARAEITAAITDAARSHLARDGAAALSLRAIARELGMVSSAVYRYFPSRDDLLTALIIEAYDAIGAAAEHADAEARTQGLAPGERWAATARGVRAWALAHPHEYALVYGSPVPGYAAPTETVAPATRTARVLAGILREAAAAGGLAPLDLPLPRPLASAGMLQVGGGSVPAPYADIPERSLVLLTGLAGVVTAELFGHLADTVIDTDAWFEAAIAWTAPVAGLRIEPARGTPETRRSHP